MKKIIPIIIGGIFIVLIVLLLIFGVFDKGPEDSIIEGDYTVAAGDKLVLEDGQKLIVEGNLTVQGEVECQNGPLTMIVKGNANIEGSLKCERPEELPEGESGLGISLVVEGSLEMDPQSKIETNGHVQIVGSEDLLSLTVEEVEKMREEIASDTGEGNRIGPFIHKPEAEEENEEVSILELDLSQNVVNKIFSVPEVRAADAVTARVSGEMWVHQPPKKVKQIVLFWFPNASIITIQDFKLIGPDGRDGESDEGNSCNTKGKDGQDAMRFFAFAPNMKINNFEILLGHGGNGGNAETKKDCDPGQAIGGEGGKSGNLKIIATQNFDITGAFIIHPGWAGNGGSATAYGKDGGPSEDGGDAIATGGDAEDNEKAIRTQGTVNGTNLIQIGSLYGGNGGHATAAGGKGGDGPACKSQAGGAGGDATVKPGDGGDAKIILSGTGAGRTTPVEDVAGDSGDRDAQPGNGGNGSQCSPTKAGGNGGRGGNAILRDGKAGQGGTRNGQVGKTVNQKGGDAGNGGDGCLPGDGGQGGTGNPNGADGTDGKNICPVEEEEEDDDDETGDSEEEEEEEPADSAGEEEEAEPEPTGECTPGEVICNQCENMCPLEQCYHNPVTDCYFCE